MGKPPASVLPFLLFDALLIIICFLGILQVFNKAGLPEEIPVNSISYNKSIISNSDKIKLKSDDIISIDNYQLKERDEIEEYLDSKNIGESVQIKYHYNSNIIETNLKLVQYYSISYLIICVLIASIFIFLAIFVLLKSKENIAAKVFHFACMGTAVIISTTWGNFSIEPAILGKITRIFFNLAYTLTPAVFIHFTLIFPSKKRFNYKIIKNSFYLFALLLGSVLSIFSLMYFEQFSLNWLRWYLTIYDVNRVYTGIAVLLSIFFFVHSYKTTESEPERKKLRWVLLGFILGPLIFIIFWVLPQAFTSYSLLPEEIIILLMSAVPITFSIAILKYHILNVDVLLRRSVVYSIVLVFLIIIYIGIFLGLTFIIKDIGENVPAIIAALFIAFLLQPAKSKIQKFVDKKFFKVQYDFRRELNQFLKEINDINDLNCLAKKIVEKTDSLIPVEKIGLFQYDLKTNKIILLAHKEFDLLKNRGIEFQIENLKTSLNNPVAVEGKVENGVEIETADKNVFSRWGMSVVFTIISDKNKIYGLLVLGDKKSGHKFNAEDIDLLKTVVNRAALTFERIKLQEELISERLETERLEELNNLKTYFVSSVSHDLKTPLTSIEMFAELLLINKNIAKEKYEEYLKIIIGESIRLARLINNVLDYSKIEKGIKEYNFEIIEVNKTIEDTLASMEYQFKIKNIQVCKSFNPTEIYLTGDKDAFEETITNLLSNAVKYSDNNGQIIISTIEENAEIKISVSDSGIGILKEELELIFNPFFRSKELNLNKAGGTGLGLSIVKNIMDAHKGRVEVLSERNLGSTFTLVFPANKIQKGESQNEKFINY